MKGPAGLLSGLIHTWFRSDWFFRTETWSGSQCLTCRLDQFPEAYKKRRSLLRLFSERLKISFRCEDVFRPVRISNKPLNITEVIIRSRMIIRADIPIFFSDVSICDSSVRLQIKKI